MARVVFEHVAKRYGENLVVKDLSLTVEDHEFLVLVGPSGCGKSTALRMIAGLEKVTSGRIWIGDRDVTHVAAKDRGAAMVFQSYALYPHMNAYQNMAFSLKIAKVPRAEIDRRVREAAEMLDITQLLERTPKQMSGGQKQRVAVGRAIVRNADVLLFDEPLSNLDAKLRVHMRTELSKLHQRLQLSTVYVTHDQIEAMTMGDRIAVINCGELLQVAPPLELYSRPTSTFVATFIGSPAMNMFRGTLAETAADLGFTTAGLDLLLPPPLAQLARARGARDVILGVRPEHLQLVTAPGPGSFTAQVDVVEPMGNETIAYLTLAGHKLVVRLPADAAIREGTSARFAIERDRLHLFDAATEQAIRPAPAVSRRDEP